MGITPWVVAEVAARRARRVAAQALLKVKGPTQLEDLCAAYGVRHLDELADAALSSRCAAWCGIDNRARTVDALRRIDGALASAVRRAEAAAALQFDVFGTHVSFDGRVDWTLDPVSGHRYPLLPAEGFPLLQEGADPKYPWAIGRLDQLVALGQGYWVANDPGQRARYAQAFVEQTRDFLKENPVGVGVQWTCAMEVALRAANLAQALRMFADAQEVREPELAGALLASIVDHCAWVEAHLEDTGRVPNNHLVANYAGLLVASALFPELPGAAERLAACARGLKAQLDAQVHADGWSFEGSIPYHRLAVELFTLPFVVARECGVDLGSAYADRLLEMFRVAFNYCSEQGLAAQVGDNDSGRVFPFEDRSPTDHGYLASLGAALFAEGTLKQSESLCAEAGWLLGARGLSRFEKVARIGEPRSMRSDAAGLHVLRTADAVLTVSAGLNGQKNLGGHSHNDKLGFELHVAGEPLIVDPGTATYTRSAAMRDLFRGTRVHATLQVDGLEQNALDPKRLFLLQDHSRTRVLWFEGEGHRPTLTARHEGYEGVVVERRFELHAQAGALLISDLLKGTGVHTVVARFPLRSCEARIRKATDAERARASKVAGEQWGEQVVEVGPQDAPAAILFFAGEVTPTLEPQLYSPGYGQIEPSVAATLAVRATLPRALATCVLWGARGNNE